MKDNLVIWAIVIVAALIVFSIMVFLPTIFTYILMIGALYAIVIKSTIDRRKKK